MSTFSLYLGGICPPRGNQGKKFLSKFGEILPGRIITPDGLKIIASYV